MVGVKGGVTTLWKKRLVPHMVNNACNSHQLALGAKDAHSENAIRAKMDSVLIDTYNVLSHSAKTTHACKELVTSTGEHFIRPKKIHEVRWSGRYRCIRQVHETLEAWKLLFTSLKTDTSTSLVNTYFSYRFLILNAYSFDTLT
jgi:hypothetical protein